MLLLLVVFFFQFTIKYNYREVLTYFNLNSQSIKSSKTQENHFGYGTQPIRATLLCFNVLLMLEEEEKLWETRNKIHNSLFSQPFSMPRPEKLRHVLN